MDASINRNQHFMSRNYARNGKIMLCSAVILVVLLLVIIGFHIYSKWRFNRRRRNIGRWQVDQEAISGSTHVSSQGLDVSILSSLPTFVYTSKGKDCPSGECAVCLSEFEDKEIGRVLPKCNHSFHVGCIDMWFYSHSNCPLCRAPVQLLDIPAQHPGASATISVDSASDEQKYSSIS